MLNSAGHLYHPLLDKVRGGASHVRHNTAVRTVPQMVSTYVLTLLSEIRAYKPCQPIPESYLALKLKSSLPQWAQA